MTNLYDRIWQALAELERVRAKGKPRLRTI